MTEITGKKIYKKDLEEIVHEVLVRGIKIVVEVGESKDQAYVVGYENLLAIIEPILPLARRYYPCESEFVRQCDRLLEEIKKP
jgi:hypothetical protein